MPNDLWPPTAQAFTDEFGFIDQDVYEAAGELWPRSRSLIQQTVCDEDAAQSWLMKACAQVTRQRQSSTKEIVNLPAYLAQTWRNLLLAEIKQETNRRALAANRLTGSNQSASKSAATQLEKKILLQEIVEQMDGWTRGVFHCLTLGYSFEEIASAQKSNAHAVRARYQRKVKQLLEALQLGEARVSLNKFVEDE